MFFVDKGYQETDLAYQEKDRRRLCSQTLHPKRKVTCSTNAPEIKNSRKL